MSETPKGEHLKVIDSGRKFDEEKLRYDLIPAEALEKVADVFTYGAAKYGDRNWEKGIKFSRVFGALLRHLFAWWVRKDIDEESGRLHLAHVAVNSLFLLQYATQKKDNLDDRP